MLTFFTKKTRFNLGVILRVSNTWIESVVKIEILKGFSYVKALQLIFKIKYKWIFDNDFSWLVFRRIYLM